MAWLPGPQVTPALLLLTGVCFCCSKPRSHMRHWGSYPSSAGSRHPLCPGARGRGQEDGGSVAIQDTQEHKDFPWVTCRALRGSVS